MINFLKKISYNPKISRLIWRLHLAEILRRFYYWLNRPPGSLINIEVNGIKAKFYVRTPWELRSLESAGNLGHEQHILELLINKVRPGDVIYDIGSNFGIYTILLARAVGSNGTVIAVEPERQSYEHLQDNLKLNALTNIRSFHLALGDSSGEAKLFLGQVTGASSLVKPWRKGERYQVVKVIEGDLLVKRENLPLPHLIKIDVEGAEYAIICGFKRTLMNPVCKLVCCEIHPQLLPKDIKPKKIFELLKSFGFDRIDIYHRGTTEYHILAQKDQFNK